MEVNLRSLFDELRVHWRDRGANTSKGNVNIKCPWCAQDPSEHLAVSEADGRFYCYRRPNEHSGNNLHRLIVKLGLGRDLALAAINRHRLRGAAQVQRERVIVPVTEIQKRWDSFKPAEDNARIRAYLESRSFVDARALCRRYDLRYAPLGSWAGRLLIPFKEQEQVISWVGRALSPSGSPKYLTKDVGLEGLVYSPRPPRSNIVIVEGPIDALKVAAATEQMPISAIALLGKQMNATRLWRLRKLLSTSAQSAVLALDSDTTFKETTRILAELAHALDMLYIKRHRIPDLFKDAGEMTTEDITTWLRDAPFRRE